MDTFLFAVNAIMPVILLIVLGYFLKKKEFLDEGWFKKGNKLVFRVCLPVLLFVNVYNIESFGDIDWSVVAYVEAAIMTVFVLGLVAVRLLIKEDGQKGVVLQCIFRSNFAIIGLPLAEALGGAKGMGIAAIISAFSIPTFNVLAVISLNMFIKGDGDNKGAVANVVKKIAKNPLIIGVGCGLIALGIRSVIPVNDEGELVFSIRESVPFVYTALSNVGKICSTLALIVLGGLFDFAAVKALRRQIMIGTLARTVAVPVLTIGAAVLLSEYSTLLNFDASVYPALVALFGSPVAVASAIMAQEMDNDGVLAGQLVVWTSIASIFTIFLTVVVLRGMALL